MQIGIITLTILNFPFLKMLNIPPMSRGSLVFWLLLLSFGEGAQLFVLTVFISNGNLLNSERTMRQCQLHED